MVGSGVGANQLVVFVNAMNEMGKIFESPVKLEKKAFKFEGLKDLADLALKEDHAVSYDFDVGVLPRGSSPEFEDLRWFPLWRAAL